MSKSKNPSLCIFCDTSTSQTCHQNDPEFVETVNKFVGQIGAEQSLDEVFLCEECYSGVIRAVEWREQVGEVERDVRSLQRIILKMMRQLTTLQSNYLGEMKKLDEKIGKSKVNKLTDLHQGVLNVVKDLGDFQNKIPTSVERAVLDPQPRRSSEAFRQDHFAENAIVQSSNIQKEEDLPHQNTSTSPATEQIDIDPVIKAESASPVEETFILPDDPPSSTPSAIIALSEPCKFCGKMFSDSARLNRHVRIHLGQRPFQCDMCSKSFNQSASLKYHKATHTGERPFKCPQCSKAFGRRSTLNVHMSVHASADELRYPCKYCGKRFINSTGLNRHVLIHTGERPFKCDLCPKAFSQDSGLYYHKKTHSGERPFKCPHCSDAFGRKSTLKTHIAFKHAQMETDSGK